MGDISEIVSMYVSLKPVLPIPCLSTGTFQTCLGDTELGSFSSEFSSVKCQIQRSISRLVVSTLYR